MASTVPSASLLGTTAADTLVSNGAIAEGVYGLAGNDTLTLNKTDSAGLMGAGSDSLTLGTGIVSYDGQVRGGDGNDTIVLGRTVATDALVAFGGDSNGNAGNDSIRIGAGVTYTDAFVGGGQGSDTIQSAGC